MLNDLTKSIINEYLDFSGRDKCSISVNEYLSFRERAEEEYKNGLSQIKTNNKELNEKASPKLEIPTGVPVAPAPFQVNPIPINNVPILQMPIKQENKTTNMSNLFNLAQQISG